MILKAKSRSGQLVESLTSFFFKNTDELNIQKKLQQTIFVLSIFTAVVVCFICTVLYFFEIIPLIEAPLALVGFLLIGTIAKIKGQCETCSFMIFLLGIIVLTSAMLKTGGVNSILSIWFISFMIFINFLIPKKIYGLSILLVSILCSLYFLAPYEEPSAQHGRIFALAENVLALLTALSGILVYNYIIRVNEREIIFQNVELRTITAELDEKNKMLEDSTEQLKTVNQQLEKFAHVVSHDLKTPLRSIIGFSQLAINEVSKSENIKLKKHLDIIVKNGLELSSLIDSVLDNSKKTPEKEIESTQVDLALMLAGMRQSLSKLLQEKSGRIRFNPDLPSIKGNPVDIRRLFQNLVENGLKYNSSEVPTVHIDFESYSDFIRYKITDNGLGINREDMDGIFSFHNRLVDTSEKAEGHGIGLYACQTIIEKLNSKLKVDSTIGKGSTFYFDIEKLETEETTSQLVIKEHLEIES